MSIEYINTKRPSIKGTAQDKDHFDRLNRLSGGHLKILSKEKELSTESKAAIKKATEKVEK